VSDRHFDELQLIRAFPRPPRGWIHAIREALGMSASVVADRLGTTPGALIRLEQSEAGDRIRLETLRRAADVLGCDLVYVLVPRRPLTDVVHDRARQVAHRQLAAVEQSMRLEDQATGDTSVMEEQLARQLMEQGGLWNDAASD
jgi:predicted DNA-binding mobile mystery protein A